MFDKDKFSELLIKARGDRNNKEYADESNVSRAYISGFTNKSIDNAPTPDIIKRLAAAAQNNVTYDDLMHAAGHLSLKSYKNNLENKTSGDEQYPEFVKEEDNDIESYFIKIEEKIKNETGLMFSGSPMSPEAMESILAAIEFSRKQAKLINEKYSPKQKSK